MAATAMLLATVVPAGAQLVPTAFGFPSIFQNSQTTAFTKDIATAQDLESLSIAFSPVAAGCMGITALPSISQTVDKSYYAEHTDFYHNEQTAAFNYPFVGIGGAALPFGC